PGGALYRPHPSRAGPPRPGVPGRTLAPLRPGRPVPPGGSHREAPGMRRGPARLSDASGSSGVVSGARPRSRVVPWTDGDTWQAFVDSAADGTIAHLWAWREVVRETYGHRTEYLAAVDGAVVRGVLPLVVVRSRLFGRHVISMPYLDYGGVCSGHEDDVDAVLVDAALALADEEGAVLQLRHRGRRPLDLPVSLEKA